LRFRRATDHRRVGGILFFDQENLGAEGEGLRVDQIDPAFVAERMRHVSTIRLKNIRVVAAETAAAEVPSSQLPGLQSTLGVSVP
jgi:hypothetical protein